MYVSKLSSFWLDRLGMKLVCVNNRGPLIPNLWCLCAKNLNPILIDADDQQVTLSLVLNGKYFSLTGVYASNS